MFGALLGTAGGGVLSGLLGTGLQGLFGWLKQVNQNKQDLAMRQLDITAMEKEYELRTKEAQLKYAADAAHDESEAKKAESANAAEIQKASYENDKAAYLPADLSGLPRFVKGVLLFMMGLVDFLRGIIRPGVTLYLLIVVSLYAGAVLAQTHLTNEEADAMLARIVESALFLTETAVTWWFGTRSLMKGK